MSPPWFSVSSWRNKGDDYESYSHAMTESLDNDQTAAPTTSVTPIGHNPIVTDDADIPHHTQGSFPAYQFGYGFPSTTLATVPYSSRNAVWSPNSDPSSTTSNPPDGTASPPVAGVNGHDDSQHENFGLRHRPPIAVAAVLPIVVLAIIGAVVFFCVRKRRKQKLIAAVLVKVQEMRSNTSPTTQPYIASPSPPTGPPTHLPATTPASPHPVILGPISGFNPNYFTGIDISDVMSVRSHERSGLGNPFADNQSLDDEPPPPYYPRSIAPLSRDTSLRVSQAPQATSSQTELLGVQGQAVPSPFDDPRDDDEVSDMSGPTLGRDRDDMSIVSDLSYQQDPVVTRTGT